MGGGIWQAQRINRSRREKRGWRSKRKKILGASHPARHREVKKSIQKKKAKSQRKKIARII